jgi:hypothetical protein
MKKIILLITGIIMISTYAQQLDYIYTHGGESPISGNNRTVTDWLHYDNGQNNTSFGSGNQLSITATIKLTPTILAAHINRQIEEIKFFLGSDASNISGNIDIQIFTSQSATPDYEEAVPMSNLTAGAWNTVTLTTPYQITGNELYVGYHYQASGYIVGADDGSNFTQHVNFYFLNGSWYELDGIAQRNWNIQVGVGGATANNDAGVSDVDIENIILSGNQNIIATITNYGTNTLNNIDLNYQINNGTVYTDNLSGLNLASGQSTIITHSTQWAATPGSYNLDVFVSNFNGNGNDDIPANDHFTKTVSVASNSTQKLPLYEEFTSSTCSPCAAFNTNYFNTGFLSSNAGHFSLIKYQMSWPSPGDPYYTDEGGNRRAYYGVSGVPDLKLNASPSTDFDQTVLQQKLDAAYAEPAYFDLSATHYIDPSTHDISVNVNLNPYLTGDYTLHCAVVEKTTTGNASSNGETEFHNVMMKMVPDANGTAAAVIADIPQNYTLTASLNNTTVNQQTTNTNVEEWDDLEVIVFLQDNNTQKIMQSTISTEGTGSVENNTIFKNLKIYPNPSTGLVNIENASGMEINIYDISGNIVYVNKNLNQNNQIDLSSLSQGIYMVKLIKDDMIEVIKLQINR